MNKAATCLIRQVSTVIHKGPSFAVQLSHAIVAGIMLASTLAPFSATAASQSENQLHGPKIGVMTQNLYLGADIRRLLAGGDLAVNVAETYEQILKNDFETRAEMLAKLIKTQRPEVISLQEVAAFEFLFCAETTPECRTDYLAILLKALERQGLQYAVAVDHADPSRQALIKNVEVTLPCEGSTVCVTPALRYLDRDLILVASGVRHVQVVEAKNFDDYLTVPLDIDGDGNPDAVLPFLRGYLIVEAKVDGKTQRLANAHLEVTGEELGDPQLSIFQQLQAAELIGKLQALAQENGLPTVFLGDLNSSPDDQTLLPLGTPYQQFVDAQYVDVWASRTAPQGPDGIAPDVGDGLTCCRAEDLSQKELPVDALLVRIDHIFASNCTP